MQGTSDDPGAKFSADSSSGFISQQLCLELEPVVQQTETGSVLV